MHEAALDWQPLLLSFALASVTTIILFLFGIPLACWLAWTRSRAKPIIEAVISLPLVLPPTVIGFYLLLSFSPRNPLGAWLKQVFDLQLVFSFSGLVVGSVIFSLPFMVQPVQAALQNLPISLLEASRTLGQSDLKATWRVLLPCCRPALLAGTVLSFAHTLGEFGVVLMIGGNIPGTTRVASIAIYNEVEALNYGAANIYALVLTGISFAVLLLVYGRQRQRGRQP